MASLEAKVREAQGEHLSLRLENRHGNPIVANYIGVGELVGAGEVVEDARFDFKGFLSLDGKDDNWSIRHHGGVLVDELVTGYYNSENGEIVLDPSEIIPAAEVLRLIAWREKLDHVVVLVPHQRARLSPLAV